MSYAANCHIRFRGRPVSYLSLVRALLKTGWDLYSNGVIHFWTEDEDGFPAMRDAQPEMEGQMWETLGKLEHEGRFFGIDLCWSGTDDLRQVPASIWLAFNEEPRTAAGQQDHLTFSHIAGRVTLPDPDVRTDRAWYENRIIPPLEHEGCVIDSIEWNEG